MTGCSLWATVLLLAVISPALGYVEYTDTSGSFDATTYRTHSSDWVVLHSDPTPDVVHLECEGSVWSGQAVLGVYTAHCEEDYFLDTTMITGATSTVSIDRDIALTTYRNCVVVRLVGYSYSNDFTCEYGPPGPVVHTITSSSGSFGPVACSNDQDERFVVQPPSLHGGSGSLSCSGSAGMGDYLSAYRAVCDSTDGYTAAQLIAQDSGEITLSTAMSFPLTSSYNCFVVTWITDGIGTPSTYTIPTCTYSTGDPATETLTASSGTLGPSVYTNNQSERYIVLPTAGLGSATVTCSGDTQDDGDVLSIYMAHCSSSGDMSSASLVASATGSIDLSHTLSFPEDGSENCLFVTWTTGPTGNSYTQLPACTYTTSTGIPYTSVHTGKSGTFGPSTYTNNQYEKYVVHPKKMESSSLQCSSEDGNTGDYIKVYYAYCDESYNTSSSRLAESADGSIDLSYSLDFKEGDDDSCFYVVWDTDASGTSAHLPTCSYTAEVGFSLSYIDPVVFIGGGAALFLLVLVCICRCKRKARKGRDGREGVTDTQVVSMDVPVSKVPVPTTLAVTPGSKAMLDSMSGQQLQMQMQMQQM
ncbi:hypothetical protein KIPB_002470 [Kipferlia bialata]|uniref:Ig-like domain-containing protein n=1 Tax=Kipferlia bialata TaxID=797122 RepID=A0A9K3CSU2_9EUKA|nr:hypothetical protein KIPB_002470 [Kipferlia bialata]|eukprot:g2470.t1